jgi:hypothetical protein
MASIIGSVGNVYFVYQFIKKLITPFNKTSAFKLGVIDKKGNVLKKRANLETHDERNSYTLSDSLVWNLKKLLAKVPGGSTKLATYAAALFLLLKENSTDERLHTDMAYLEEEFNKFMDSDETNAQIKQLINESEKKSFSTFTTEASMLANKLYLMHKAKQLAKKDSGDEKEQEINNLEQEAKKLGFSRRKYEEIFDKQGLYEFAGEEGTDKLVKKYKKVTPGEVCEIPEDELDEGGIGAISLKQLKYNYHKNEDENQHTENYLLLARAYGTPAEVKKVEQIMKRNEKQGHTSKSDNDWMYKNINPYYKKMMSMKEEVELDEISMEAGKVYHQDTSDGPMYFKAVEQQKNKRWKGLVLDIGQKKPKNGSADEKLRFWKATPDKDVPPSLKEEVELDEEFSEKDFDSLKKGDTITIEFKSPMSSGKGTFKVTAKNIVGKAKVHKATLKDVKRPGGVKFFLYKRGNKVSLAQGDMAASVVKYTVEQVELDEAKFSNKMIDALKSKYESLRGKRLSLGQNVELEKTVKQLAKDKEALTQLVKADIPFISMNARLILNKDYGVPLNSISEKAVSQQQQKFMGLVRSIQKGKASGSPEAEKAAKEMDPKDVKDFASTKHTGLPKRKAKIVVDEGRDEEAERAFQQALLAFKKKGGKIDKLKDSPTFKSLFGPGYKSKKMPRQAKDVKIFGEGKKYKLKNNEETGVSGVAGIGADTTSKLGSDQSEPGVRKKKQKKWKFENNLVNENTDSFAGINVFDVSPTHFEICRMGKRKYLRYEKYVGNDESGEKIRQYGRDNPKLPIILKNSQTGAMLYLRYAGNHKI